MTRALVGAWLGADRMEQDLGRWWQQIERRDEPISLADKLLDAALDRVDSEWPSRNVFG